MTPNHLIENSALFQSFRLLVKLLSTLVHRRAVPAMRSVDRSAHSAQTLRKHARFSSRLLWLFISSRARLFARQFAWRAKTLIARLHIRLLLFNFGCALRKLALNFVRSNLALVASDVSSVVQLVVRSPVRLARFNFGPSACPIA